MVNQEIGLKNSQWQNMLCVLIVYYINSLQKVIVKILSCVTYIDMFLMY